MNAITGLWICYSCGARGTLASLVSELKNDTLDVVGIHTFLIESGLRTFNQSKETKEETVEVDWLAYSRFDEVPHMHLYNRNLSESAVKRYGIRWDTRNKAWVIPIVSPSGQLMGWQTKKVGWVRNYPIGVKKSQTLFGIERFTGKTAVLVESPLDVVRLASACDGVQGLATFGAFVSDEQFKLLYSVATKVIIAMDNDEAGINSSKALFRSMPPFNDGVLWLNYKNTKAKDIGDMHDEEMFDAISTATAVPGWIL